MTRFLRSILSTLTVLCTLMLLATTAGTATAAAADGDQVAAARSVDARWAWPLDTAPAVLEPFRAPAHAYGAGHRGIDIAAPAGTPVRAPAGGIVAFRGTVVDRPLLTIDHGDGYVSTFEPLASELAPGAVVSAGDDLGVVATGGHAAAGSVHLGVRVNGVYIDPMLLFGAASRAVLLPCCAAL